MKVLVVHNFYQSASPSGEDRVFKNEVELLKKRGIDVVTYTRHNDEIINYSLCSKFSLSFRQIWSRESYIEIKAVIRKEKPNIVHFHNIWYLVSPSAYDACKEMGIPIVQTLHNFRIFCVNGLLLRDGRVCESCLSSKKVYRSGLLINAIRYGCYRNSRIYTIPIAFSQWWHWMRKTWLDKIDAYIALTEFGKKKFIEAGLPQEKIFVKPNFLPDPPKPSYLHKNYVIFIGRISKEKGVDFLLDAAEYLAKNYGSSLSIKIVGDGPLRRSFENEVKKRGIEDIEFTGRKDFKETIKLLSGSRFMIIPSVWYETFSLVGMEAFACGKPVIASNLGATAELVEDGKTGLLFEPGNPYDLAKKIKWMIENEDESIKMGKNAREVFEEKYREEKNFKLLMDIYERLLTKRQG